MSHIVQIQTQVRDAEAARLACRRLGLSEPASGTFELYQTKAEGLGFQLPGWTYPVVCDLAKGELKFDNFGGHWKAQT